MYEGFFGLRRRPFAANPDVNCFAPIGSINEVLTEILICLRGARGIAVLTAAAGMGKTLLCQRVARELDDAWATVLLTHTGFPTRRSLLQAILHELGLPYARRGEQELRHELQDAARQIRQSRRGVVVLVDEAHLLDERLLEELRSLTNMIDGGEPLFQVLLSGQMGLDEMLAAPAVEPFRQRIGCQVTLEPLTQAESAAYLNHCASCVGASLSSLFTDEAVRLICHASDGLPRCLNQLADHSLLLACVMEEKPVSEEIVSQALEDLRQLPLHWNQPSRFTTPAGSLERDDASDDVETEDLMEAPSAAELSIQAPAHEAEVNRLKIDGELFSEPSGAASLEVGYSVEVGPSDASVSMDETRRESDESEHSYRGEPDSAVTLHSTDSAAIEVGTFPSSASQDEMILDPWGGSFTATEQFEDQTSQPISMETDSTAGLPSEPEGNLSADTSPSTPAEPGIEPLIPSDAIPGTAMPSGEFSRQNPPAEETIVDRYALIDAGLPLPEVFPNEAENASPSASRRADSIPAWAISSYETSDLSPEERIDRIAPLLAEALSSESEMDENASHRRYPTPVLPADASKATVNSQAGENSVRPDAEDALDEAVLDTCLETLRVVHPQYEPEYEGTQGQPAAQLACAGTSTTTSEAAQALETRLESYRSILTPTLVEEEPPRRYSQLFTALRKKLRNPA